MRPDLAWAEFEAAVPQEQRRRAGAFWTPERVAERLLDAAGWDGRPCRIVDPACGGGALLWAAGRRMLSRGLRPAEVAGLLAGADIDPRAVAAARNTLESLLDGHSPELVCADALAEPPAVRPAELVVANPPWIRFADLPQETKQSPLWRQYGLFSLDGRAGRRSEEHTSELQSRGHLVCRLLLEKKK